jgi:NAD(P)-dependent dehydrogenase (short-subunit alcohol dehydrogenase family)
MLTLPTTEEASVKEAAARAAELFPKKSSYLHLAFAIPGILHAEKSPSQIDYDNALLTFRTNTLGPLLLIKHFSAFLPKKATEIATGSNSASSSSTPSEKNSNPASTTEEGQDSKKPGSTSSSPSSSSSSSESLSRGLPPTAVWATMSARVGSISDNRAGGWYSYRASKSGVNQITKSFDQHLRATAGDRAMAIALHPGTVKTGLSKGFWESVGEDKLFTAEDAAGKLINVVNGLGVEGRGRCWDWKGEEIMP